MIRAAYVKLLMVTVMAICCLPWPGHATAEEFLFHSVSQDGYIFSVRLGDDADSYRWFLGGMGQFTARLNGGTTVKLRSGRIRGRVRVNGEGEVMMKLGGPPIVLQESSLGYGCYVATLKHYGSYNASDFEQNYLFREVGLDDSLWSVKKGRKKGQYIWYMGGLGKGKATVKGTKVQLRGKRLRGTLNMDDVGDVTFKAGRGKPESFPEGTLGYSLYEVTIKDFGSWREPSAAREVIFENASHDGGAWKVVTTTKPGVYTWYMGEIGKTEAHVKGRVVSLRGAMRGKVQLTKDNELVMTTGRRQLFMDPLSLGFSAFQATLEHFGTWTAGLGEVKYLFKTSGHDGVIWSVKKGSKKGQYDWNMGEMGRVQAKVNGTTVNLKGKGFHASVSVNKSNEVVIKSGRSKTVYQEGSLGLTCYEAILKDAGTWRDGIGKHNYIYRDASATGELWAVIEGSKAGQYIWYMGDGEAVKATVKGNTIRLRAKASRAKIVPGPNGDPILKTGGREEFVLHPGSFSRFCYEATLNHARR